LISCHIDCWLDFTCFLVVSQSQLTISDVARKAFLHSVCGISVLLAVLEKFFFALFSYIVAQPELLQTFIEPI
jgi:hypothetical protein